MRLFTIFTLLILLLAGCNNASKTEDEQVLIEGHFTKSSNEPLYLLELNAEELTKVDSTIIDENGYFRFRFVPSENPQFYVIRSDHFNQAITLLVQAGEQINLGGDLPNLNHDYQVANSPGSERVYQLTQIINGHMDVVTDLYATYRDNPDSLDLNTLRAKVDSLLRVNQVSVYEDVRSFIKEDPASLSSLLALYSSFGRNSILEYKYDSDLFQMVSDSLIRKYPNSSHAVKLHQKVLDLKNADELKREREAVLEPGKQFPEIILYDVDNKPQYLSRCKAKVCIVTAWASTDKPSWDLNEKLKSLYQKYHVKGLEIYAISFDTDKLAWVNYCHMNHWDWINVIGYPREKQMLNAEDKLPRVFVLDANRKVLAKDPEWDNLATIIEQNL
jgi:hypothetical protein